MSSTDNIEKCSKITISLKVATLQADIFNPEAMTIGDSMINATKLLLYYEKQGRTYMARPHIDILSMELYDDSVYNCSGVTTDEEIYVKQSPITNELLHN